MIRINGVEFEGQSVSIVNEKVIVDGKDVTPKEKHISIIVNGNIDTLDVDACEKLGVNGDVGMIKTLSGDILIGGKVNGNVKTMSGDVRAPYINGNVKTMSGDIKMLKAEE